MDSITIIQDHLRMQTRLRDASAHRPGLHVHVPAYDHAINLLQQILSELSKASSQTPPVLK